MATGGSQRTDAAEAIGRFGAEWLRAGALVVVAAVSVKVGAQSWLPYGLVLAWCGAMGLAGATGYLQVSLCCRGDCDPAGSQQGLNAVLGFAEPGRSTPELELRALSTEDALVVAGAVREFGGRVGLERFAATDSPALGVEPLRSLAAAALEGERLRLVSLDLSRNPALDDKIAEASAQNLQRYGWALKELRLADCNLTAVALAPLAAALRDAPAQIAAAPAHDGVVAEATHTAAVAEGDAGEPPPLPPPPPPPPFSAASQASATASSQQSAPPGGGSILSPPPPTPPGSGDIFAPPPPPLQPPPLDGAALRELAAGCRLQLLSLSGNALAGGGRALGRLLRAGCLKELELARCGLQLDDVSRLAACLPRSGLRRLELAGNALASKGLLALSAHLAVSGLDDLGLEDNELGRGSALEALAGAYSKRAILRLRLEGNRLSQRELSAFMQSLKAMPSARLAAAFGAAYGCAPGCECNGRGEVM